MAKKEMKVSEFLEKSLDLLGEHGEGWVKGTLGRPDAKRHCVLGAFHQLSREIGNEVAWAESCSAPGVHKEAVKYYESAILAEEYKRGTYFSGLEIRASIPGFNDDPRTKFFDIKKVFKKAIEQAKTHEKLAKSKKRKVVA